MKLHRRNERLGHMSELDVPNIAALQKSMRTHRLHSQQRTLTSLNNAFRSASVVPDGNSATKTVQFSRSLIVNVSSHTFENENIHTVSGEETEFLEVLSRQLKLQRNDGNR